MSSDRRKEQIKPPQGGTVSSSGSGSGGGCGCGCGCDGVFICAWQDEPSTLRLLKEQLALEQIVENYAETVSFLSQQCRRMLELGHPDR